MVLGKVEEVPRQVEAGSGCAEVMLVRSQLIGYDRVGLRSAGSAGHEDEGGRSSRGPKRFKDTP